MKQKRKMELLTHQNRKKECIVY